jgi:TPR repeat protein
MSTNEQIHVYNRSLDLLQGQHVAKDLVESFRLNALAAKGGYHDAVLAMGWYFIRGVGVEQNVEEAKKWYRKSARQGEPRAMFSLGQIAYMEKDFSESLMWFRRAEKTGHPRSSYYIGRQFWNGQGVEQNRKEAIRLFQIAAKGKVEEAVRLLKYFRSKKSLALGFNKKTTHERG